MAEYFCALVFMRPFLRLSQHLASDGLERPRNFKMSRQPQKWSHGNRGAKIFSHVKYELNLFSGTPSNRLLNDKTAPVFISMFLRSRLRIKLRSLDANGGRLRPFEAEVKLWVSKFIF